MIAWFDFTDNKTTFISLLWRCIDSVFLHVIIPFP